MIDEDDIVLGVWEDNVFIIDVHFNKVKQVKRYKFPVGYATLKINNELKCYFAIRVQKELLDKIDDTILFEFMGDAPFIFNYEDSVLYLRTKLEENFFNDKKNEKNKLSKLLKKGE